MSKWNRTSKKKPSEPYHDVLGWDAKRGYLVCYWYTHASGKVMWTVNGTSGGPVKPPAHWCELPQKPQRRGTTGAGT